MDKDKFFIFSTRPSRGNPLKIVKPRALTTHKQYSFSHRVVNNWNDLPTEVVLADSLNIFKGRLEKCWKYKEFKFDRVY